MRYETAALKLALDALENTASRRASEQFVIEQHAIAFIKKALDRVDPAPASKPWVGLTDDEIALICAECSLRTPCDIYYARAIEAKLRERNEHLEKNA